MYIVNKADKSESKYFDKPKYYPLKKLYTTTIEININCNHVNKLIPINTFHFAGDREQADH